LKPAAIAAARAAAANRPARNGRTPADQGLRQDPAWDHEPARGPALASAQGTPAALHFRKQHPIGPYILDFYCHAARLAVEIDGEGHWAADRLAHDLRRDRWLMERGVRTLRLSAKLVLDDVRNATRMIESFLDGELGGSQPPQSLRDSSPSGGASWALSASRS